MDEYNEKIEDQKKSTEYPDFEDFRPNTEFKTDFKRMSGTFFVFLILFIGILLLASFFYLVNDNTSFVYKYLRPIEREYNADEKAITLIQADRDLAKIKLNTPQVYGVFPGKDRLVWEYNVETYEDVKNLFTKVHLYDLKRSNIEINREITYKLKQYYNVTVDDYDNICPDQEGYVLDSCYKEYKGSHTETRHRWVDFDYTDLKSGNYTIGAFTDVKKGDYVEWIPEFLSQVDVPEWASWNDTFNTNLIIAYTLDDGSGTNAENKIDPANYNGTLLGGATWENAVQNTGACFNGSQYINTNANTINTGAFSLSVWVNGTNDGDFAGIITNWGESDDYSWYLRMDSDPEFLTRSTTSRSSGLNVNDGGFHNIVVTYNSSHQFLYIDGVLADTDAAGTTKNTTVNVNIGRRERVGGSATYISGCVDEVYMWDRALTTIEALYLNDTFFSQEDTTSPVMTIIHPTETNYSTAVTWINYTYIEANPGFCLGSNDSGITNSTPVAMGTNITGLTAQVGLNTFTLYCNDTTGNLNSTSVTFNYDNIPPVLTNLATQNVTNLEALAFDIDATDTGGSGLGQFSINWTDTFSINDSGYLTNATRLWEPGRTYLINVSINDSVGNLETEILTVNVNNFLTNPIIYDAIDDSSINYTQWSNTSTNLTFNIYEDTEGIRLGTKNNSASGTLTLSAINLPDLVTIDKLAFYLVTNITNQQGAAETIQLSLDILGDNESILISQTGVAGNELNDSIFEIRRNETSLANNFDIFQDGIKTGNLTAINNNFRITLNMEDAADPYASGNSTLYFLHYEQGPGVITITANHPANDSVLVSPIEFNISTQTSEGQLQNISILFENIINETLNISGTSNETIFNKDLALGVRNWSIRVCNNESTCSSSYNMTITSGKIEEISQIWENSTTEGDSSYFELNLTIASLNVVSAYLTYNNTNYSAVITNTAGYNYTISRNLNIPPVTTLTNQSFYWYITLNDGFAYTTDPENQTVKNLLIGSCASYSTLILNYTLRDEEDQTILNATGQNTSIEVDVDIYSPGGTVPIIEYSNNFTKINPATICINQTIVGVTYEMDAIAFYSSAGRVSEYHNIQNYTLTSTTIPQHINLYDLGTTNAQEFLITFKDDDFLEVEDALIDITRYYISEGLFKTVELPKTDSSGQTLGHFNIDDNIIYTIIVSKEGEVLATFNNILPVCDDATVGDCTINLNALSSGTEVTDWENKDNLSYSVSFNPDNRRVTVTYTTSNGGSATVSVNTTRYDRWGNLSVCYDTLVSSSGTLTCDVPSSFGNLTILSEIIKDGEIVGFRVFTLKQDPSDTFGGTSVFLLLLLMLTLPFMFIPSTIAMVVSVVFGMIFAVALVIVNGGGILGTSSAILWLIIAAAIIIWQINQRSRL